MKQKLSRPDQNSLLEILRQRFAQHPHRHQGIEWSRVLQRLEKQPDKLWSLHAMQRTGGEPDVIGRDTRTQELLFCDCAAESPMGRRSLCYDRAALDARKQHKPAGSALDLAAEMGVRLLSEEQYFQLQQLEPFDTNTSSWLLTPPEMRQLGGALFGDYRFGRVFIYHNGAESYYGARGFRALLRV